MVDNPASGNASQSLPVAPEQILAALRAMEQRMSEQAAELKALRLAIEVRDQSAAVESASSVHMTTQSTLTIGVTATATVQDSSEVDLADSVGLTDAIEVTLNRAEQAPSAESRSWIDTVRKHAPVVGRVVEWALRIYLAGQ